MNNQEKADLTKTIQQVIKSLQSDSDAWVDFARIGAPLSYAGVQYKEYGFAKLRKFLNEFKDVLEFKDVQPEEEKPPVCYVRLKTVAAQDTMTVEDIGEKRGGGTISNSEKPPYQNGKSALMALGYVKDIQKAVEYFVRKTKVNLNQEELENRIKKSYDEGDILYYEYNEAGDPVKCKTYTPQTAAFAVNTGVTDSDKNYVFAQYNKTSNGWIGVFFNTENEIFNQINAYNIGKLTFKNYASANKFINDVHEMLLPGETWKYAEPAKNGTRKKTEYEILQSYLSTVFDALVEEHDKEGSLNYGKIKFSKKNSEGKIFALFNTGLLSKHVLDILVVGEVYKKNEKITLSNPTILKRGMIELIEKGFDKDDIKVDMVNFFNQVSQIVYDATAGVDLYNIEKLEHCIGDGIKRDRFPEKCKKKYKEGKIAELTEDFINAIRRAEKIARRNYKYVVPQYRSKAKEKENKIQFLMPIYMSGTYDGMPDFALVLSEGVNEGGKYYTPETVLELAWAYNNARVICKPDDMWLNPARIKDVEDVEEMNKVLLCQ